MSERGSFCTEYIYCDKCLDAVKSVLMAEPPNKSLAAFLTPSWETGHTLPIISGKIGGTAPGDEIAFFEHEYGPAIAAKICHPMMIAVLAENGSALVRLAPGVGACAIRMEDIDRMEKAAIAWAAEERDEGSDPGCVFTAQAILDGELPK